MPKLTFDELDSQVLRPENDMLRAFMAAWRKMFATGVKLVVGTDTIGATLDAGPAWTTVRGVSGVPVNSADMTTAAAVTDVPTTGQKLVIDDILISAATAMSVSLTEETSGTVIRGPIYLAANSTTQITLRGKTKLATANKKLLCTASVAGNLTVEAVYHSEA